MLSSLCRYVCQNENPITEEKHIWVRFSKNYLVQAIVCVYFTSVTAWRFVTTNDSNRHTLLGTILQLSLKHVRCAFVTSNQIGYNG